MNLSDVRIGMLVNRLYNGEPFGDNPVTVVGFNENKVVTTGADGQTISVFADHIEPAHDGCQGCKHTEQEYDEAPCLYCRHNTPPNSPFYGKLPDLWEEARAENDNEEDTVQISREDAELVANIASRLADAIDGISDEYTRNATELRELAERLRWGS